jgi:transcriptional regulator with XRE-family HTH domain
MEGRETLKDLIKAANLTYRDLAERLGTDHTLIVAWTKGRKTPKLDNVILLSTELGVSLKVLCAAMGYDVSKVPDDITCDQEENHDN